jgi:hypothetical protein
MRAACVAAPRVWIVAAALFASCSRSGAGSQQRLVADPFPLAIPIDGWTEAKEGERTVGYAWSSEAPDRVFEFNDARSIDVIRAARKAAAAAGETSFVLLDSFAVRLPHPSPYGVNTSCAYSRWEDVPVDARPSSHPRPPR